jgi:hypothetical protein
MKPKNWTLVAYLLVVFLTGVATGVFGQRYYAAKNTPRHRTPEEGRRLYVTEMRTRLKMSDAQVAQMEQVLNDTRAKFRELDERKRPEVKAIQEEQVQRIEAFLSPEQRAGYAQLRKEREERRKEWEKKNAQRQ